MKTKPIVLSESLVKRFWARILKSDGCWLWTGALGTKGYGRIGHGSLTDGTRGLLNVHRLSWVIHNDQVPDGMCVLHSCDVRACANPDHLFIGTIAENNQDMVSKSRQHKGSTCGTSKLTEESIIEIRARLSRGEPQRRIAVDYGVCQQAISRINILDTWKHVTS